MAMVKMTVSYYFDIEELDDIENCPEDIAAAEMREVYIYWQNYLEDARDEYTTEVCLEEVELA